MTNGIISIQIQTTNDTYSNSLASSQGECDSVECNDYDYTDASTCASYQNILYVQVTAISSQFELVNFTLQLIVEDDDDADYNCWNGDSSTSFNIVFGNPMIAAICGSFTFCCLIIIFGVFIRVRRNRLRRAGYVAVVESHHVQANHGEINAQPISYQNAPPPYYTNASAPQYPYVVQQQQYVQQPPPTYSQYPVSFNPNKE